LICRIFRQHFDDLKSGPDAGWQGKIQRRIALNTLFLAATEKLGHADSAEMAGCENILFALGEAPIKNYVNRTDV
jgi:hypothetical protein